MHGMNSLRGRTIQQPTQTNYLADKKHKVPSGTPVDGYYYSVRSAPFPSPHSGAYIGGCTGVYGMCYDCMLPKKGSMQP